MADVYAGGIPVAAGKNLFPGTKSDSGTDVTYGGEGAVKSHDGSPTASKGFSGVGSFVGDKDYRPGGALDVRPSVEMSGKTVNPDDLSYS